MKNITIVAFYAKQLHDTMSHIDSQDEFNSVFFTLMAETLLSKEHICKLVFYVYKYPDYIRPALEEIDDGCEDVNDSALRVYRRILSGAYQWNIERCDIFPKLGNAHWLAPWVDGVLAERPIRHVDIPTFFIETSSIVSPFQLALANIRGDVDKKNDNDFEFDFCIDLDDPSNFEDEDVDLEANDFDSVMDEALKCGFKVVDSEVVAAAQVIDVHDDEIIGAFRLECAPLLDVYHSRVVFVANYISELFYGLNPKWIVNEENYHKCCKVLNDLIGDGEQTHASFSSMFAKLMFVAYPKLADEDVADQRKTDVAYALVYYAYGLDVQRSINIRVNWVYYGHYPLALLNYFAGKRGSECLQDELRKEFDLDGPKEAILVDESFLMYKNDNGEYIASEGIIQPLLHYWSDTHPIVVKAASKNYHLKKSWLLAHYPYVIYSVKPMITAESSIDMMVNSSFYQSLCSVRKDVLLYGDDYYGYERSMSQLLVCAGFAFKSVLFRDEVMFRDHLLPPCVGFQPITGWSNRKSDLRIAPRRFSKYPEMAFKRTDVGIDNADQWKFSESEDFSVDNLKLLEDDINVRQTRIRQGTQDWSSGWLSVRPSGTTVADTQLQQSQVLRAMAEILHSVRKNQMDDVDD
jgi:hypothetical protein